ncbi:MAG: hypothetical protein HY914_03700 [Desulfomonile tiedjei]|nr:hypothetical protein [Desulfomonile tiedjei]
MDRTVSRVNIRQLLENSLCMIEERARENGLRLEPVTAGELAEVEVQTDEVTLKQITFDLLPNAPV